MDQHAPTQQITAFLARFGDTLARADIAAAEALFTADCYWRDLVAFTWNITTAEGLPAITTMLHQTLGHTAPAGWAIDGAAERNGALVEAWFTFETAVGRGVGHLRLRDGRCHTLFTALRELKGFEERQGPTREQGVRHGAFKDWSTKPGGAELVQLRKSVRGAVKVQRQAPLEDGDEWVDDLVDGIAKGIRTEAFPARANEGCGYCRFRTSCPSSDDGAQVMQ